MDFLEVMWEDVNFYHFLVEISPNRRNAILRRISNREEETSLDWAFDVYYGLEDPYPNQES